MINNEIIKLKFDNSFNGRLFAVQGDTGRVFNLQVFDDFSKPVDVTSMHLRMYVANAKEVSYSEGEVVEATEGKVKVQVYNSQLKYPGKQKAQFVLTDKDGQKIGSKIFDLWVEEGLETGSTVGNNIYVDFDKINQILDLIKNYDKTLEEAKKVDSSLKLEIKEGTDARNNLADCKKKALEIKGQLDTSKVDAQNVLKEFTSAKNTLIDENKKASSNLTSLDAKIAEGKQTVTNLEGKTSAAKATDAILKATDTEAKNTESLIRDLINQIGKTENEVKQIIASGDLSKYVTDPKLQEALKSYATKEDLSSIDVTGQLVDYAKKTQVPTKLSQLNNDKTFKTETEILQLINNAKKLKKEVVTSLPTTGKDDVIYLLKNKNDTNNYYTEYMWISGKWEIIGDTKVDLSGYAKKTDVVTSVNGKKGNMMVDFFVGDDTRNQNYAPKDYLERGTRYKSYTNSQFEFKRCTTVGVDRLITQDYCIVNTQVPWADKSGGLPMQIAYGKGVMAIRTAKDENTWGEWQKVSTSSDLPTRLSQLSDDSTHRVVTDSEKQTWNDKVDKVDGKGLSTNDYDATAKSKVDSIPTNPKYTDTTYDLSKYAEKSNISRCKTKGYNTSNTWQPLGTERDLEDWIGDFDKRTRELKESSGGEVEEISLPSSAPSEIKAYKCGHLVTIVIDSCSANVMARMNLTLPSKIRPVGDGVVIFTPEGGSTSYLRIRSSGDMYLGNFNTNGNVCATVTYITNN